MIETLMVLLGFMAVVISESRENEHYFQEVSYRSAFKNFEPTVDVPISTAWDTLPFESLDAYRGSTTSMMPEQNCVLAMSKGVLYGQSLKSPAPVLSTLENPFTAWDVVDGSLADNSEIGMMVKGEGMDAKNLFIATEDNLLKVTFEEVSD